jgi:hypothetical protein
VNGGELSPGVAVPLILAAALLVSCSSSQEEAARAPSPPPATQPASERTVKTPPKTPLKSPLVPIGRLYLDEHRDVHVVTVDSESVRVTFDGRSGDPKLSPDQHTVGMLVVEEVDNGSGQTVEVSSELRLLRGGAFVRRFEPGGFIRDWAFVRNGQAVAVYSGGLHFAGFYVLYDAATGEQLDYAADPPTASSPDWVRALSP